MRLRGLRSGSAGVQTTFGCDPYGVTSTSAQRVCLFCRYWPQSSTVGLNHFERPRRPASSPHSNIIPGAFLRIWKETPDRDSAASSGNLSRPRSELTGAKSRKCDEFHEVSTKVVSVRFVAEERNDMRTTAARSIRITHRSSGEIIPDEPLGCWGITPFEGNLYISRKCLKTGCLRPNWLPRLCIYKFLYVSLDLRLTNGAREPFGV